MDQVKATETSSPLLTPEGTCCVTDYILVGAGRFVNRVAQVDVENGTEITFGEIIGRTVAFEKHLRANAIKSGDVVLIMSNNTSNMCWLILGVLATGSVCALLNPVYTARELKHFITQVKPKVVIAPSLNHAQLQELVIEESIREIYAECKDSCSSKVLSYISLIKKMSSLSFGATNPKLSYPPVLSDPAFYLPSSGTTGLPKAIVLSHGNVIASLTISGLIQRFDGIALGLLPFFHAFGLGVMLMALCEGSKLVIPPRFSIKSLLTTIADYEITHLFLVPSIVVSLGKSEVVVGSSLKTVRETTTGAGLITYEHQLAFKKKLSESAKLFHSYGMTETTFIALWAEMREDKPSSIGRPIQGFKFKIIKDNGEPAKNGEVGELLIRSATVFREYLHNAEGTEEALDKYRWLHSGDLVYKDDDDYYFYVERRKEMIKYQGYQISPSEIEMALLQHKAVEDAAVIGLKHEVFGEIPRAFIVKKNGMAVDEDELLKLVKEELSPYKQLRGGVHFTDAIPRNSSGKVMRALLREITGN